MSASIQPSVTSTELALRRENDRLRQLLVDARAEGDRCTLGKQDAHSTELVDKINLEIRDWRRPRVRP